MIGAFPTIRFQSGLDRPADSGVAAAAGFFHDNFVLSVCLVRLSCRLSCRFVLPARIAAPALSQLFRSAGFEIIPA